MNTIERSFVVSLVTGLSLALSICAASAQRPNTPLPRQDTPAPTEQQRCAPQNEPANPPTPKTRGQGPSSEQLAKSNGVICPPAGVDPEITAPPPGGGRTPVIPPPASPGGNPDVRPQ